MKFPYKLQKKLEYRKSDNSFRTLYDHRQLIDFSSNDYLGFSKNRTISMNVKNSLDRFEHVNGSTGSRLLSGNSPIYEEVESELAEFFKTPAALIFNSGYDANIGLFSCIPQHGDVILFDELCHASIRDGIRLSYADTFSFKHNNIFDLEKKFKNTNRENGNTFLVVESIYSMDGDQAPLKAYSEFCSKNGIYFIVDEAHSTGIYGKNNNGLINELELEFAVFARIHTFGKALGCHGAVVVGDHELRDFLINYARSFIYTTSIPIHSVLTIKYALKELKETAEVKKLKGNISTFIDGIVSNELNHMFIRSESAIQSFIGSNNLKIRDLSKKLQSVNFDVKAILPPTVPAEKERLRFCIHSYNSYEQIHQVLNLLSTFV
jgi:8-amino-7-oxononanoate synthase